MMTVSPRGSFFTLVEVLVTMLVMSVIAALVVGAFHSGLMCTRKTAEYEKTGLQLASALSMLNEDLRSFVPFNNDAVRFENNVAAFYIVPAAGESHLELVTYSFRNGRLERSSAAYSEKAPGGAVASVSVLDEVDGWTFSYKPGKIQRNPVKTEDDKNKDKPEDEGTSSLKDRKKVQDGEFWPVLMEINGRLQKGRVIQTSVFMPFFNAPDLQGRAEENK